ncbi:MAG TPA: hypothetical protein VNY30_07825, partial [Bryobacteraceae bacterium]|nr:hypothetical protein [Bryobacteraceae bacterium]
ISNCETVSRMADWQMESCLPPGTVYAAYVRFLQELNRGTDARHTTARQRFIAHMRSLRSDRS